MIESITSRYQKAAESVISAIKTAAEKTGTDFGFLMEKAAAESNFKADAQSSTSSASGLFQFIESTWLDVVKKYGDKYGLDEYASKIESRDGKLCVSDCATKQAILDLRNDPEIAALMAGEYSAANKKYLEASTNGEVGSTELYLAHFMGAKGAAEFLNEMNNNGNAKASAIFTKEARANKGVFYDSTTGEARSLSEVYGYFDKKFSTASDVAAADASTFRQQGDPTKTIAYLTHTHNAMNRPVAAVPVYMHTPQPSHTITQALSYSDDVSGTYADNFTSMFSASKIYAENLAFLAQQSVYENSSFL